MITASGNGNTTLSDRPQQCTFQSIQERFEQQIQILSDNVGTIERQSSLLKTINPEPIPPHSMESAMVKDDSITGMLFNRINKIDELNNRLAAIGKHLSSIVG